MFSWFRKNKLPITQDDKIWVDENIEWLKEVFGIEKFNAIQTIRPNSEHFDYKFTGQQKDAEYVLHKLVNWMSVLNKNIKLEYITDGSMESSDGKMLANPAEGIENGWRGAAGTYRIEKGVTIISIDLKTLKNPEKLIAVMSHELSHELLLGEGRIIENDEYLTDLTAVFFGFGIFIGNTKFKFKGYSDSTGSGWSMSSMGYLPEQIIAYAMAKLSVERKEETDYMFFLDDSLKRYFEQSISFLNSISEN